MPVADIKYAIWLYLFVSTFSLVGFPIVKTLFKKLPDGGYAFFRIVGLLAVGYVAWASNFLVKIPLTTASLFLYLLILLVPVLLVKKEFVKFVKENYRLILFEETIFLFSYVLMIIYRTAVPKIEGIEKFMDFAIINGLARATQLPPKDVWFSGEAVNYYYFGHYLIAVVYKLTRIPTAILYNLYVAYVFAQVIVAAFSLNLLFVKKSAFALLGAMLLAVAGNLDYLKHKFTNPGDFYFYAKARSLIEYTINEFPAYSFLISDLHAHILNIPYVLLVIATLTQLVLNKDEILKNKYILILPALFLGTLSVINSWDYFVYLPLLFVALLYLFWNNKLLSSKNMFIGTLWTVVLGCTSLFAFSFFYLNFKPAIGGIGFTSDFFSLEPIFTMFGLFLLLGISWLFFNFLHKKQFNLTDKIVAVLFLYGVVLIFLPQVVFLKDIYYDLNPDYFRANTIFKLWYQAWIILAVTASYYFFKLYSLFITKKRFTILPILVTVILFICSVFDYTRTSVNYVVGPEYANKGLDGSRYLLEEFPGEKDVITWLNTNVKGQPVILEATGKPYSTDSLISTYTGLPTLVGWDEHELGWRNDWPSIATRLGDVETLYKSNSLEEANYLISKYNIEYVVIGTKERAKYGSKAGHVVKSISTLIYKNQTVELLKIN